MVAMAADKMFKQLLIWLLHLGKQHQQPPPANINDIVAILDNICLNNESNGGGGGRGGGRRYRRIIKYLFFYLIIYYE